MLTDAQIGEVLAALENRIQDAADELVRKANECGGVDNVSVVIARVLDVAGNPACNEAARTKQP